MHDNALDLAVFQWTQLGAGHDGIPRFTGHKPHAISAPVSRTENRLPKTFSKKSDLHQRGPDVDKRAGHLVLRMAEA